MINAAIVSIGFILIFSSIQMWKLVYSFSIGALAALIYIFLLSKQIKKYRYHSLVSAKKEAVMGLATRYGLLILIIAIASRISYFNIFAVLSGILIIPISAVITAYGIKI